MNFSAWISVGALAVMLMANLVMFSYFMGGVNAKLNALQVSVDSMKGNDSKIAVLDERLNSAEDKIDYGTHMLENHARQILALSRGDRLPEDMTEGRVRRTRG